MLFVISILGQVIEELLLQPIELTLVESLTYELMKFALYLVLVYKKHKCDVQELCEFIVYTVLIDTCLGSHDLRLAARIGILFAKIICKCAEYVGSLPTSIEPE